MSGPGHEEPRRQRGRRGRTTPVSGYLPGSAAAISPAQQLLESVAVGQLVFNNPPDLRQLNDIAAGNSNVKLATELVDLLLALLARGQVSVMSLIRTVNGGHTVSKLQKIRLQSSGHLGLSWEASDSDRSGRCHRCCN